MIDVRTATGVPCITTCPVIVRREFFTFVGVELDEWQDRVLRAHGFTIADGSG